MEESVNRGLFRLRWAAEWVRVSNAQRFQSAVIQGFSSGVFFSSYSHDSNGLTCCIRVRSHTKSVDALQAILLYTVRGRGRPRPHGHAILTGTSISARKGIYS